MTMDERSALGEAGRPDPSPPLHPFLLRLATRLLSKAERSEGLRAVRLRLDRTEVPELYDHFDVEDLRRIELLLNDLCRTGWVLLRLTKAREFAGLVDRNPQLELVDFDALADWAGYLRRADSWNGRLLAYLGEKWESDSATQKQDLLDYLNRSPVSALSSMPAKDGMLSLYSLRSLCVSGAAMPLREASARVFQGRSKVLDSRDELLRLLGAAPGQFWEAPIQLLVDIPPAFDQALFVENLVTFEQMADTRQPAWARSVLIYAAGFKGSAKRLRSRQGCRIYVRPSQRDALAFDASAGRGLDAVGAWLFGRSEMSVRLFGDLDFAGMQILASLREVFPDAEAWPHGYGELAGLLSSGGGHLPEMASKERQTDPGATGCSYADGVLLPLMRQHGRFVDQEVFAGGIPIFRNGRELAALVSDDRSARNAPSHHRSDRTGT